MYICKNCFDIAPVTGRALYRSFLVNLTLHYVYMYVYIYICMYIYMYI